MAAQAKILRVLKLIGMLKTRSKSIKDLAQILDTTERSVYRYLELLEEVGFLIDKDFNSRYFIHTHEKEEHEELNFNHEEAQLLKELINTGARDHPLKEALMKKLYLHSDLEVLSKNLLNARTGILVEKLGRAIKEEKQVVLRNYHSAHSNEVRDRLIEPVCFHENYDAVISLDTEDHLNKHFKLDRIGEVVILNKRQKFKSKHEKLKSDMFGMSGGKITWVDLKMNLRAYVLLREEHPMSIPYLDKTEDGYSFHGPVYSFEGIGRFVLGLVDAIEEAGPKEFIQYLNEKIERKRF